MIASNVLDPFILYDFFSLILFIYFLNVETIIIVGIVMLVLVSLQKNLQYFVMLIVVF